MRPPRWVLILVTFHVVALLWVLFRAPDISTAVTVLKGCLGGASFEGAATFIAAHLFEGVLILAFFLIHPWDDGRRVRIMAKNTAAGRGRRHHPHGIRVGHRDRCGEPRPVHLFRILRRGRAFAAVIPAFGAPQG